MPGLQLARSGNIWCVHESNIKAGAEALTGVTGSFRFWFADQRWEWSDEVAALHGNTPGQVEPTTKLLLSHKHPDDRDEVADTIETVLRIGLPFKSSPHHRHHRPHPPRACRRRSTLRP